MSEKNSSVVFNKNSQVRRSRRMKGLFVVLLLLIVLIVGAVAFLRKPEFQISSIKVVGTRSLDPSVVSQTAWNFVSGSYAVVIPRTNALLLSKTAMQNYIKKMIPSIQADTVEFSQRNVLQITVTEKKPAFVWCSTADCYFVDDTGVLYEESPVFSDGVFVTFTGNTVPLSDGVIGSRFVSQGQFAAISSLIQSLQAYPFDVLGVTFLDSGDIQIRIDSIKNIPVSPSAYLLISGDTTASTVTQMTDLLLADSTFSGDLTSEGSLLQYIDLRLDGKIYYKFSNSGPVVPAGSDSSTTTAQ